MRSATAGCSGFLWCVELVPVKIGPLFWRGPHYCDGLCAFGRRNYLVTAVCTVLFLTFLPGLSLSFIAFEERQCVFVIADPQPPPSPYVAELWLTYRQSSGLDCFVPALSVPKVRTKGADEKATPFLLLPIYNNSASRGTNNTSSSQSH